MESYNNLDVTSINSQILAHLFQNKRNTPRYDGKEECLLAVGGAPRLKTADISNRVSCYNPTTDEWHLVTQLPEPRHHHAG